MLRRLVPTLPLLALAVAAVSADDKPKRVIAKVTPAADTTVATGPVDKDGFIDYEVALNERMRGAITPESNAVTLLFTAVGPKPEGGTLHADFYKWLGRPEPPADAAYVVMSGNYFLEARGPDSDKFYELYSELQKRPWTAKEFPKFAEWLAVNERPLLAVTDASKRPDYYYPFVSRPRDNAPKLLIGALLPLVQKVRELAAMLCIRAMQRCGEGKSAEALDDVMAVQRLGRLMARGASLIEMLVGIAIDALSRNTALAVLEHGKVTPEQLARFRDELLKLPPMPQPVEKVTVSERFMCLELLQAVRRYGFLAVAEIGELPSPNVSPETIETVLAKLDWDRALRKGNAWYDRLNAAMTKPTRAERMAGIAEAETALQKSIEGADLTAMFKGYTDDKRAATSDAIAMPLVRAFLPAVSKVQEASDRQEIHFRTLLLAVALEQYKAETKGYPETLADLAPKFVKAIPVDLYNGDKPLVYKRTKAGYELYSVGPNGKDDGCQLITDMPRGDDLGQRMPAKKEPDKK